jgi:hypothetical protein
LSTQCPKIVRQAGKNIIICNYLSVWFGLFLTLQSNQIQK